ncbi:tRNA uridine-5-carboxymethylaminomethyl(34) synthesis GTPase MnmE [Polluticoccus soli]|uniref:tRNA uridine-5-carboxymethylaminomethyl(34) synthesis GTPase MnmE n=1 Tax=Polluticoccus soli TaxID=3034150 RepID=UPI0023E230C3|nr:tRNA uridine-5-carboxymethylaminomethyl(34) synthesis GTPase MnmE [Flavipsychrobacter sp. JY13-12]
MYQINETIVALATPPGEGAIGVIRLSGKDAITIADKIFKGKKLANQPSHTIHFGKITDGTKDIDEVVASLYKAPKSYTGEDVVEISCHGSHYVLQQVIDLCTTNGAHIAKPGEFTQRAFLNGKMDLTQAEAVADLIASRSGAAHNAAMHNLRGGFSHELKEMREELIKFSALIELELDFSEEDVEFADRGQLYALLEQLTAVTQQLVQSFRLGNAIRNGVSVAIIGKPNAGKSTLLNALLNEERAIVSDIAGTTRDTIEETLNINGVLFRLIDTAGIREHSADVIENIGIQRSMETMKRADIVVYLFDVNTEGSTALDEQATKMQAEGIKYLLVANKTDLADAGRQQKENTIYISAKNKDNIRELKQRVYDMTVQGEIKQEGTIVTNARHYQALQEVLKSLLDIKAGMDNHLSGDLIALDIRRCLHYLGDITGQVTTEDKLDYIFSKFCIGK